MTTRKEQTSGPGIYLYDPEQHRDRSEDALGNITPEGNGRHYLSRWEEIRCEFPDGSEFALKFNERSNVLEIRNQGRAMARGIAVLPSASNVIEVLPFDY